MEYIIGFLTMGAVWAATKIGGIVLGRHRDLADALTHPPECGEE